MSKKQASFKEITENYRKALKAFRDLMAEVEQWDELRVSAEQEKWEQEGGNKFGGEQPLMASGLVSESKSLGERYASGDAIALFRAMEIVIMHEIPAPDWVAEAFDTGVSRVRNYEVRTLDEAFGYSLPKNAKLPKLRKKAALGYKVVAEVIRRSKVFKEGITDAMFDSIGLELGMSGPSTKELYYEVKKETSEEQRILWEWIEYIRRRDELNGVTCDDEPGEDDPEKF